jgi:hypothetical protein
MRFLRPVFHFLRDAACAVVLSTLVMPAAVLAAEHPHGAVSDGTCVEVRELNLAMLDEAIREAGELGAPSLRIIDDRVSVAVVFTPRFHGPRAFGGASGFTTATSYAWNPTPMVTGLATERETPFVTDHSIATTDARRTDPGFLAKKWVAGVGHRALAMTVDAFAAKWSQWWKTPGQAFVDQVLCSPVFIYCYSVLGSAAMVDAGSKAGPAARGAWASVVAPASYGDQAEMLGERTLDVVVLLAPFAKGTGSAALDEFVEARSASLKKFTIRKGAPSRATESLQALREQYQFESTASAFKSDGSLADELVKSATIVTRGEKLGSQAVENALTRDGSSMSEWGKYETKTLQSPAGDYKVHFYLKKSTGVVNYEFDYKMKFDLPGQPEIPLQIPVQTVN